MTSRPTSGSTPTSGTLPQVTAITTYVVMGSPKDMRA